MYEGVTTFAKFLNLGNLFKIKMAIAHNLAEYGWISKIQKLGDC